MARLTSLVGENGLWESLRALLQAWWGSDRIRTFPTTGRILALRTGDRFLLMEQIWTVTFRDIKCHESLARVRLGLSAETHKEVVELFMNTSGLRATQPETAGLRIDGKMIPVRDEDISLLPSKISTRMETV